MQIRMFLFSRRPRKAVWRLHVQIQAHFSINVQKTQPFIIIYIHIFLNSAFRSFGICVLSIHGLLLRYSQTRGLHIRPWDACLLVPLLTHWAVSMAGRWPQLSTFGVSKFGPGLPMLSLQNYHPGWTSESSLCIATEILMVLFWWLLYRVGNLRFFVTGRARQDPPYWETWSWNVARIFFPYVH